MLTLPMPVKPVLPVPLSLAEAVHQANVNGKAQRLYSLGYSGHWSSEDEVEIVSPSGSVYRVNAIEQTCECAHFARHRFCSHLWGWPSLMRGMAQEGACIRG